jgi:hypothetical protein
MPNSTKPTPPEVAPRREFYPYIGTQTPQLKRSQGRFVADDERLVDGAVCRRRGVRAVLTGYTMSTGRSRAANLSSATMTCTSHTRPLSTSKFIAAIRSPSS